MSHEDNMNCGCRACAQIRAKVKTSEEWDAEHEDHGPHIREPYDHPNGNWYWLVCSCGKRHLRIDKD